MGWFRKKSDPITDQARALNDQIARLEAQIEELSLQTGGNPDYNFNADPPQPSQHPPQPSTDFDETVLPAPTFVPARTAPDSTTESPAPPPKKPSKDPIPSPKQTTSPAVSPKTDPPASTHAKQAPSSAASPRKDPSSATPPKQHPPSAPSAKQDPPSAASPKEDLSAEASAKEDLSAEASPKEDLSAEASAKEEAVVESSRRNPFKGTGPQLKPKHSDPPRELGVRKPNLTNSWRRFKNNFRGPATSNPKLVNYLAAGSIQGLRPLRYEKRVARNRFLLLLLCLIFVLWGIIAIVMNR